MKHLIGRSYGLDVGGKEGTILTILEIYDDSCIFKEKVSIKKLSQLNSHFKNDTENISQIIVIDAPLDYDINSEGGMRKIDKRYLEIIDDFNKPAWVASPHSLMAVPTKGNWAAKMAAEAGLELAETHPRVFLAQLCKKNSDKLIESIKYYKCNKWSGEDAKIRKKEAPEHCSKIWKFLLESTGIQIQSDKIKKTSPNDDDVDSLVCAIVGAGDIIKNKNKYHGLEKDIWSNISVVDNWTKENTLFGYPGKYLLLDND